MRKRSIPVATCLTSAWMVAFDRTNTRESVLVQRQQKLRRHTVTLTRKLIIGFCVGRHRLHWRVVKQSMPTGTIAVAPSESESNSLIQLSVFDLVRRDNCGKWSHERRPIICTWNYSCRFSQ
jgi:hypothetical protein